MEKIKLNFDFPDDGHYGMFTEGVYNDEREFSMSKTCFEFLASKLIRGIDFKEISKEYNTTYTPSCRSNRISSDLKKSLEKIWLDIRENKYTKTFYRDDFFVVCYENAINKKGEDEGYFAIIPCFYGELNEINWIGSVSWEN